MLNAIAANDATQKQESLVQNKQDQQDSLEAAQKAIDEAQSDVDKYKKKGGRVRGLYLLSEKSNHEDTSEYDAKLEGFKSSLEAAQKALDTANDNYASVLKSTDRSVASAQNTVDMQKLPGKHDHRVKKDQLEQLQKISLPTVHFLHQSVELSQPSMYQSEIKITAGTTIDHDRGYIFLKK